MKNNLINCLSEVVDIIYYLFIIPSNKIHLFHFNFPNLLLNPIKMLINATNYYYYYKIYLYFILMCIISKFMHSNLIKRMCKPLHFISNAARDIQILQFADCR